MWHVWEVHERVQWVCRTERGHWEVLGVGGKIILKRGFLGIKLGAWTDLARDRDGWCNLFNSKLRGSIQRAEFLDELRNYQLLNTLPVQFVCELLILHSMMQRFS